QLTKAKGEEAIKLCEEKDERESAVRSVRVADIQIGDGTASAEVGFVGSTYDGQTVIMDLVEEDGQWKIDEMTGFVDFDADRLISTFRGNIAEAGNQTPAEEAETECVLEELERESDANLEGLLLDPESEVFVDALSLCTL